MEYDSNEFFQGVVIEMTFLDNGPHGASFFRHLEECDVCRAFNEDHSHSPLVFEWGGIVGGEEEEEEEEEWMTEEREDGRKNIVNYIVNKNSNTYFLHLVFFIRMCYD